MNEGTGENETRATPLPSNLAQRSTITNTDNLEDHEAAKMPNVADARDGEANIELKSEPTPIFRAIAIPSSLRSVAPFLEEAQAHAG